MSLAVFHVQLEAFLTQSIPVLRNFMAKIRTAVISSLFLVPLNVSLTVKNCLISFQMRRSAGDDKGVRKSLGRPSWNKKWTAPPKWWSAKSATEIWIFLNQLFDFLVKCSYWHSGLAPQRIETAILQGNMNFVIWFEVHYMYYIVTSPF